MRHTTPSIARSIFAAGLILFVLLLAGAHAHGQGAPAGAQKTPAALGTIKSIDATSLTLTTDNGSEVHVQLATDVKVLRVPPGSKDLKEATPMTLAELQTGDRILVRMRPGADASSLIATTIIAMKKADIAEKQAKERDQWQRHGIGGLVKTVDAASGAITIGTTIATGSKDVVVRAGKDTILRRYASGSIKFDDAKPAPIAEIHPGDQLRARGTRNADGSEFAADEIVSGSFRNIAGPVTTVNAGAGTLTVSDIATKKPVEIKITPDSQLRKVPAPIAQRIVIRLKGQQDTASNAAPGSGAPAPGQSAKAAPESGGSPGVGDPGPGGAARAGAAGGDMQQMLSRLPASTLNDFQKGDVVMIVATAEESGGQPTAITLLGGVEPILQATTQSQAASILSPWNMSQGGGGGDAGTP